MDNIHKNLEVLEEMLLERGYTRIEALNCRVSDDLILLLKATRLHDTLYVLLALTVKCGVRTTRAIAEICTSGGVGHYILLSTEGCTPFALREIQGAALRYELFKLSELRINITRHCLVPKHELLTSAERKALLLKHNVKPTELPRLKGSDPIARYYNFPVGSVVRIHRNINFDTESEIYYRLVV